MPPPAAGARPHATCARPGCRRARAHWRRRPGCGCLAVRCAPERPAPADPRRAAGRGGCPLRRRVHCAPASSPAGSARRARPRPVPSPGRRPPGGRRDAATCSPLGRAARPRSSAALVVRRSLRVVRPGGRRPAAPRASRPARQRGSRPGSRAPRRAAAPRAPRCRRFAATTTSRTAGTAPRPRPVPVRRWRPTVRRSRRSGWRDSLGRSLTRRSAGVVAPPAIPG